MVGLSDCRIVKVVIILNYLLFTPYCLLFSGEPKITSKQIEFRKKENKIIFKDNVKVTQNGNYILCDYAVKDDKAKVIEMSGNITGYYLVEPTGTIKISSEFGKWKEEENLVELSGLSGKNYVIYTDSTETRLEGISDRIVVEPELKKITFLDNVVLTYAHSKAKGELAEYSYNDKKITLVKNNDVVPVVYYSNQYRTKSSADNITLLLEEKKMFLEGNVYSEIAIR